MPFDRRVPFGDAGAGWAALLTTATAVVVVFSPSGATTVPVSAAAVAAVAAVACTVLLVERARFSGVERSVWMRWAPCAPAMAVSVGLTGLGYPAAAAVVAVAVFPLAYGAAVRWNRYATSLADPHEAINGIASVLALTAAADLLCHLTALGPHDLPWVQRLVVLSPIASAAIIFATLLAIIPAAGLARDRRAWLMVAAVGLVGVLTAAGPLGLTPPTVAAVLALTAWCAGSAAHLPPGELRPRPVNATDSTVGGFVILMACIGVLLTAVVLGIPGPTSWLAAAAACLGAVRLLRNVHDIAMLSSTRREALTDDLTGLPNRRALLRTVTDLLAAGRPVVLAIVDLDGFKQINDSLGHAAGDQLLAQMAHQLQAALPATDLPGRLGGDEFAVVSPLRSGEDAGTRMGRLGADLLTALGHPIDIAGFLVHGNGSVGLTATDGHMALGASDLLQQADAAMYEAKATRGTAVRYDPARHAPHGQLQLLEELRTALAEDQLTLHHQPQVDISTGRLVGVEALVRWNHPTRGLLHPAEFIGLAEAHGLMGRLTEQVLHQAVAQLAAWRAIGPGTRMSVNLSASNLLDTALPARVTTLLDHHHVPAQWLTLEVTESVLVQDSTSAGATLLALSRTGVDLSIDDFGTGWSSLAYLRRLPARELKLDRSFTQDLITDPRTHAIVASTITLAHDLGLRVVAEGVEDLATFAQLRTLGCDLSQGYLHARPMPAHDIPTWIDQQLSGPDRDVRLTDDEAPQLIVT